MSALSEKEISQIRQEVAELQNKDFEAYISFFKARVDYLLETDTHLVDDNIILMLQQVLKIFLLRFIGHPNFKKIGIPKNINQQVFYTQLTEAKAIAEMLCDEINRVSETESTKELWFYKKIFELGLLIGELS